MIREYDQFNVQVCYSGQYLRIINFMFEVDLIWRRPKFFPQNISSKTRQSLGSRRGID